MAIRQLQIVGLCLGLLLLTGLSLAHLPAIADHFTSMLDERIPWISVGRDEDDAASDDAPLGVVSIIELRHTSQVTLVPQQGALSSFQSLTILWARPPPSATVPHPCPVSSQPNNPIIHRIPKTQSTET